MKTGRVWLKAILIGIALSTLSAAFMMRAAWIHNAQGEIHNESGVDWTYLALIGASWFVPVFLIITPALVFFLKPKKNDPTGFNR